MSTERRIALALRVDELAPHHQDVLSGVLDYARERPDWHCVVDEHPTYSDSRRGQASQAYDGVIARASPELQRRLKKFGTPLVNVWYQHAKPTVPGVYPDLAAIGRTTADHLIDHGFRTLAFMGPLAYRRDSELGKAFASAAVERGHSCLLDDCGNPNFGDRKEWLGLQRHVKEFLDTLARPVGIFVSIPSVARLVMTHCLDQERHGARSVGVVCLDDVKTVVELSPQITSVDCNYLQIGRVAAGMLDDLMAGKKLDPATRLVPPKGVKLRESTDYFAVDDETVAAALRYISRHLRTSLGIEAIAKAVATSPRTLQRRFEAAMGCSVGDEIRRLRVELAKRLLVAGRLPIEQVARETGFSSPEALNHFFHREVGMSPRAYRKQVRGT